MIGLLMLLSADTSSVDIRSLVAQDMSRAAMNAAAASHRDLAARLFGISDFVLVIELGMLLVMSVLLVAIIVRARKITRLQREKVASAQRMTVKRTPAITKKEIERILGEIAADKARTTELSAGNYFVDHAGQLDSGAAVHEMARAHGLESERLNFAISYASQAARQSGAKFKEAFAMVSEASDLNALARQLNMGKGELELIRALKRSKIATSRTTKVNSGGNR